MLPVASLCGLSCLLAIGALALSTTTAQVDTLNSISTSMLLRACCCARFPAYAFKKEPIALDNNAILTLTW